MLGRGEEGQQEEQDFHDQVQKALETEMLVLMSLWVLLFLLGPEPGTFHSPLGSLLGFMIGSHQYGTFPS